MMVQHGARVNAATLAGLLLLCGSWYGCQREPSSAPAPAVEERASDAPTVLPDVTSDEEFADELVLFAEGEPEEGVAPLTVRFQVESLVEEELEGAQYTWNFGDGSAVSREANPTHIYERPGDYTVTVRVVDAKGQRGWDEVEVAVDTAEAS